MLVLHCTICPYVTFLSLFLVLILDTIIMCTIVRYVAEVEVHKVVLRKQYFRMGPRVSQWWLYPCIAQVHEEVATPVYTMS